MVLYRVSVGCSSMCQKNDMAWHMAMILLNPCPILIKHGHLQYNCISLGLTIAATWYAFYLSQCVWLNNISFASPPPLFSMEEETLKCRKREESPQASHAGN
ncbi:hypothetical protein SLE2022_117730 [Rubroshorea leprosula]